MKKLLFLFFIFVLFVSAVLLAQYTGNKDEIIPLQIVIIRAFINFVAAFAVLTAFVTFATEYIPAVRVVEARNSDAKNLIYYKIQNYSKTLIKNMIVCHALFDIPINGKSIDLNQIHIFQFNLSPEKFYVGPVSSQEFVINLNRIRTDSLFKSPVTLDVFTHHTFLLVTLAFSFWFWPFKKFRIRGVLYFDRENNEWFSGTEERPELKGLFKDLFIYLENDDKKSLKKISDQINQSAKDSWGELYR